MGAVFVTGATGTVGSAVVEHLLQRGQPVITGIRDLHDDKSVPGAVEARSFSFDDAPDVIEHALEGADRLFLMRPPAIADVQAKRGCQMFCVSEVRFEGEHHGEHGYQSGARGASSPPERAR